MVGSLNVEAMPKNVMLDVLVRVIVHQEGYDTIFMRPNAYYM